MGRSAKQMGVSMFKAVYDMQVRWNEESARFVALTIEEARDNMPSALVQQCKQIAKVCMLLVRGDRYRAS